MKLEPGYTIKAFHVDDDGNTVITEAAITEISIVPEPRDDYPLTPETVERFIAEMRAGDQRFIGVVADTRVGADGVRFTRECLEGFARQINGEDSPDKPLDN